MGERELPGLGRLNLLVDESPSTRVALLLAAAGHDAVHVGDLGLLCDVDESVMRIAREARRILVSANTDFGELLTLGSHAGPSVVLLRRRRPEPRLRSSSSCLGSMWWPTTSRTVPSSS